MSSALLASKRAAIFITDPLWRAPLNSLDSVTEDISKTLAAGEVSELAVVAEGEERTTWFVWMLVFCTSISGLLFGMSIAHFGMHE